MGHGQGSQTFATPSTSHKAQDLVEGKRSEGEERRLLRQGQRTEDRTPCSSTAGAAGKALAEFRRRPWMKPCEGRQLWWAVRILLLREEAGAERVRPLSGPGRPFVSEVM